MGSKPSKAERRRNTDNVRQAENLQYHTPYRNVAHETAQKEVARAPAQKGRSGWPKQYRNQEGEHPNVQNPYKPWEIRGDPQLDLIEVPVTNKPAGHVPFNCEAKSASAKQIERPTHKGARKDRVLQPFNDPNVLRANAHQDNGHLAGVTYHPPESKSGFERAPLEPLDRETGQHVRQHRDMESRPVLKKFDLAQRGKEWDKDHPDSNRRVMTVPGREQGSGVMTDAIGNFTGGRRNKRWVNGQQT